MAYTDEELSLLLSTTTSRTALAKQLKIPLERVLSIVPARLGHNADMDDLSSAMMELSMKAMNVAMDILTHGTPSAKLRVSTLVVSRLLSDIGQQTPAEISELRLEMQKIFDGMRGDVTPFPILSIAEQIDVDAYDDEDGEETSPQSRTTPPDA